MLATRISVDTNVTISSGHQFGGLIFQAKISDSSRLWSMEA